MFPSMVTLAVTTRTWVCRELIPRPWFCCGRWTALSFCLCSSLPPSVTVTQLTSAHVVDPTVHCSVLNSCLFKKKSQPCADPHFCHFRCFLLFPVGPGPLHRHHSPQHRDLSSGMYLISSADGELALSYYFILIFFFAELGVQRIASHTRGELSTTKLQPQCFYLFFFKQNLTALNLWSSYLILPGSWGDKCAPPTWLRLYF